MSSLDPNSFDSGAFDANSFDLEANGDAFASISGVSATGQVGNLTPIASAVASLAGVSGSGSVGTVGATSGGAADVKVSWLAFDSNATPVDVKVSWLAFDTQATPCDVRVSWVCFDSSVARPVTAPPESPKYYSVGDPLDRQRLEEDEILFAILQMFVLEEA